MIGYTLKHVLEILPEAHSLVKTASVDVDWPTDSRDSAVASALCVQYAMLTKSASVDFDTVEAVSTAVLAFGADADVNRASAELSRRIAAGAFEKTASARAGESYASALAQFENAQVGISDIEGMVKAAHDLKESADIAGIETLPVRAQQYLCDGFLVKAAAVQALELRHWMTGNEVFEKLASALQATPDTELPKAGSATLRTLCETVTGLDKQAGLQTKGFDFYREALIEKSAAASSCSVKVAGKDVPLTTIQRIPKEHVAHYIDKDLANELAAGDPMSLKAAIEALPMDSHHILANLVKHV